MNSRKNDNVGIVETNDNVGIVEKMIMQEQQKK